MSTPDPSQAPAPAGLDPIRRLSALSTADLAYAGGKGANLGQLTRCGIAVPPGFVVGAPAYAAFRAQTGVGDRLTDALGGLDVADAAALRAAATDCRRLIEQTELPGWLAEAIVAEYEMLTEGQAGAAVAVRSSGTAGDLAAASFPAMNETFLDVTGPSGVIGAVKRCWVSLFSPRTIRLGAKRKARASDLDVAVIVQRQVASTRSGVMCTTDPASGVPGQLVIAGSLGFGDAAASDDAPIDRYVVDKSRMTIVTRPATDGVGRRAVLSDDEVLRLAEIGVAIEREYRAPQDTEWTFDPDGRVWMLQSRPMRTSRRRAG